MKSRGKILVTPRSLSQNGHELLSLLTEAGYKVITPFPGRQPSAEELQKVLPECIGYLAGVEKISGTILEQCPGLKVISRNGVGFENIDTQAAERLGIAIKITRGANARGVAELTLGLLFSLIRKIPAIHNSVKRGGWDRSIGLEIYGKTLGVVGTGKIGELTARMAAALGMNILAYDLYPNKALQHSIPALKYTNIRMLFTESDMVTFHCPAGEHPLINRELIQVMKKGSFIINTSRAALVDQDALLDALERGHIAGYAVDAFESEPPLLSPLLLHPNTILTAHIGGFTKESVYRATQEAITNILEVLQNGAGTDV
ncbi:MAG: phosphoglycerate dehydrogenase [Spirochaetia bacterium]|nr:phosphoglycerate dehydrogenase [Spirochaetia bacterium]